jgi:hypothetical protein
MLDMSIYKRVSGPTRYFWPTDIDIMVEHIIVFHRGHHIAKVTDLTGIAFKLKGSMTMTINGCKVKYKQKIKKKSNGFRENVIIYNKYTFDKIC